MKKLYAQCGILGALYELALDDRRGIYISGDDPIEALSSQVLSHVEHVTTVLWESLALSEGFSWGSIEVLRKIQERCSLRRQVLTTEAKASKSLRQQQSEALFALLCKEIKVGDVVTLMRRAQDRLPAVLRNEERVPLPEEQQKLNPYGRDWSSERRRRFKVTELVAATQTVVIAIGEQYVGNWRKQPKLTKYKGSVEIPLWLDYGVPEIMIEGVIMANGTEKSLRDIAQLNKE